MIIFSTGVICNQCGLVQSIAGVESTVASTTNTTSTISETTATIEATITATSTETETTLSQEQQQLEYRNTQYGFNFLLPISWEGYFIVISEWEGFTPGGDVPVEHGTMISIRHPKWTSVNPRQDIPIMVFTLAQWDSLQQEKFHIGAAPIGPSELGRNTKYVFALPARYNFSYLTGYEEVEKILENKTLQAF